MSTEDHQPIEPAFREAMEKLAEGIDQYLNGEATGDERPAGFVLLVFPFGDREGRLNYISNGADREDLAKLFREMLPRLEAPTTRIEAPLGRPH